MTEPDPRLVAIVLAGGASRRFGGDKLAAPLLGRPLLHHALERVGQVAQRIVVVVGPGSTLPPVPGHLAQRVRVARDEVPFGGPLAGVVAGLEAVGAEARVVIVAGGDMPTLEPAVLRLLVAAASAPGATAAVLESAPPAPLPLAVRPGPALAAARALLAADRRSLAGLVEALAARGVEAERWRALDPVGATLADVDSPADLR